ncbi:prenyltransferase/squalene oxidase repeat-containing protein [Janibacter melonis]|uniref:prenyltransferase/squalene oxidase repeat-containing protein n=1 Tax=Janibacter melonis TaxID=262209 RepID=UPI00174912BA|nr:prenyltransferase/squalene oxidase repeat-containing protein [Janibacter melonis]
MPLTSRRPPFATLLTGAALAAAATLALAPAAQAAEQPSATTSAAYLAAQLEANDDRLSVSYGDQSYDDPGVTIDAILAMQATGTAGDQSQASTDYVLGAAGTYTGSAGDELYVGATGKLLTLTASRGLGGTVGGTDYLGALPAREQAGGQFTDDSQYGDYSNTLGQSFSIIGLERHGVDVSDEAVDFLLTRQCADGGFALENAGACTSDPDATSVAVQALSGAGGQDAAITEAVDYLQARQGGDGGVGGGTSTSEENSNSTGLAAVAFRLAGRTDALTSARGFLDSVRLGCESPDVAGALAYTPADAAAADASTQPSDQLNRSTAQALLGSTDVSYLDVTSDGAAAAPVALDCADEPTPGDPSTTDPSDEPSTSTTTVTATARPTTPGQEPTRPEVVQTDDARDGGLGGAGWVGAGILALVGAGALVGSRRRGAHR